MSEVVVNPYWFVASETCETVSNDNGLTGVGGGGGETLQVGMQILSGSPFIGLSPTEIKFQIAKRGDPPAGNPTGVGSMKIYNGSNVLLATSTNTINASTVASYPTWTQKTWEFSGLSALAENDKITVQGWTVDDDNQMSVKLCDPSEYDSQKGVKYELTLGWRNMDNRDCDVCMK